MREEKGKWKLQEQIFVKVCSFFSLLIKLPMGLVSNNTNMFLLNGQEKEWTPQQSPVHALCVGELLSAEACHVPLKQKRQVHLQGGAW